MGVVTRLDVLGALAGVSVPSAPSPRIDLGAIERNCARLPKPLCAVVKADALRARRAGGRARRWRAAPTWLAVATADEAAELRAGRDRRAGAGDGRAHRAPSCERPSTPTPTWWPGREEVGRRPAPRVHVKLDTGMGRLGTKDRELALRARAARPNAVGPDDPLRHRRRARRRPLRRAARGASGEFVERRSGRDDLLVHAANSAAALREPASHFDMVRCGVAIYGLDPFQRRPRASTGSSRRCRCDSWVAAVRRFEAGRRAPATAAAGRAPEPTWVATLPIGYGDGWRRAPHEQRRRADRRAPPPAGRHGQHGQHHGGARRRTPTWRSATRWC